MILYGLFSHLQKNVALPSKHNSSVQGKKVIFWLKKYPYFEMPRLSYWLKFQAAVQFPVFLLVPKRKAFI